MTRDCCASCYRPLLPATGHRIGPVRFCELACVRDWFNRPEHDRRHAARPVQIERRRAA